MRDIAPLVPVTVTVAGPVTAELEAEKVIFVLPPSVEEGLKTALIPDDNPLATNATAPGNPPIRLMLTVALPVPPLRMESWDCSADREKSGCATTVMVTGRVREIDPDTPVIVIKDEPAAADDEAVKVRLAVVPLEAAG